MELRYLAALEAVAATGSFAGAADELGYTRAAISQQVAALERLVGQPLVDRLTGRAPDGLTQAGTLLLGHTEAVLARMRIAGVQLEALAGGRAGTLRVGTFHSVGVRLLPGAIARLSSSHPDLRVALHEATDDIDLVEQVVGGKIDVTFCVLPTPEPTRVEVEVLLEDPYLLVVSSDSPLGGPKVALSALGSLPMIAHPSCRADGRVTSYLRGLGIDPDPVARVADDGIIQALVAEGRGVAMLPRMCVDHSDPGIRTLELDGWLPPRQVGLAWLPEPPHPGVEAFVQAAHAAAHAWASCGRPAA